MQKKSFHSKNKFNTSHPGNKTAKKAIKRWDESEKKPFKHSKSQGSNRFKLFIEYDGTRYSGWQMQQNSKTIQGTILSAAEQIFKDEKIELYGSGRTDAGVHALCQIAHLDVKTMLAPEIIKMKLNDLLPHDINIIEVQKAPYNFHARYSAVGRSYIYLISKRRSAFGKQYIWWLKDKLNINLMRDAAKFFEGKNDFASFTDKDMEEKSTLVIIDSVSIIEKEDLIMIHIKGSHFLWKMVRRMVGVLVEIGRGKLSDKNLLFFLSNYTNEPAVFTAPPSGLYLEQVWYKDVDYNAELNVPINIINFSRLIR